MAKRFPIHPPYFIDRFREDDPKNLRDTSNMLFAELHRFLRYLLDANDEIQETVEDLVEEAESNPYPFPSAGPGVGSVQAWQLWGKAEKLEAWRPHVHSSTEIRWQFEPAPVIHSHPHTHEEGDIRLRHERAPIHHSHPHQHRWDEIVGDETVIPPDQHARFWRQPHTHRYEDVRADGTETVLANQIFGG